MKRLLLFLVFIWVVSCSCYIGQGNRRNSRVDLSAIESESIGNVVQIETIASRSNSFGIVDTKTYGCNGYMFDSKRRAVITAAHCVYASWIGVHRSVQKDGVMYVTSKMDRYEIEMLDVASDFAVIVPYRDVLSFLSSYDVSFYDSYWAPITGDSIYFFDRFLKLNQGIIDGEECVDVESQGNLCVFRILHEPHKGDSGSPVFNKEGDVIGIIVAGDFDVDVTYFILLNTIPSLM